MLRCFSCFFRPGAQYDRTSEDNALSASGILALGHYDKKAALLEDTYDILYQIGEGKTGQVFAAKKKRPHYRNRAKTMAEEKQRERECDEEVAVKMVRQEYLSTSNRIEALQSELAILAQVKHPGILRLRQVFQDDDKFAIVTDKATGGEILDAMCRPGAPRVSESDVAEVIRQLLSVLAYLHLNGITHRDVKVENILCKSQKLQDGVLLIDFGLAHMGTIGGCEMSGMNGTPHYMAPEMYRKHTNYDCAIDLWSLGVVTYVLLFGQYPFDARFLSQVEDKIVKGEFEYPAELESQVSQQAKKFIEYLLVRNPRERPPAAMALQHPWLQTDASSTAPFTNEHMAALANFSKGKKVFVPPTSKEYVPPKPVPEKGVIIYEG
ncbi:hypothetical protein DD237_003841 [Peronospora effusa]|uniref:Protein kinase domain-containing protein n=1 Tax=Peronospora effusa TaxID=542832 RepID=A0A3R7WNN6_9STRA|nr:hypothetical protein DD237_003841 [Peronospora effusa]